jgi:hypothetical protein
MAHTGTRPAPGAIAAEADRARDEAMEERRFLDAWSDGRAPMLPGVLRVRQILRANAAAAPPSPGGDTHG